MPSFIIATPTGLMATKATPCSAMAIMSWYRSSAQRFKTRKDAERWITRRSAYLRAHGHPNPREYSAFNFHIEEIP